MQLDLFSSNDVELLKLEITQVKTSSDKVRRGMFARHNELAKMYLQQQQEIDYLKSLMSHTKENKIYELQQA